MRISKWSAEEIEKLRKLYPFNSNESVATQLNKPTVTIKNMAHKLYLKKNKQYLSKMFKEISAKKNGKKSADIFWTDERIQFLKDSYFKISASVIAGQLGCSAYFVYTKARNIKLSRAKKETKELPVFCRNRKTLDEIQRDQIHQKIQSLTGNRWMNI